MTGFKKAMLTLHLESAAPVEGELATLTFKIDAGLDTTVNQFTYTVSNIALTAANGEAYTAAQAAVRLPLSAYYSIQPGPQAVGMSSVIAVYEKDGSPAAGVTVSLDGAEIGKTDANGLLETDAMKTKDAGTVCVLTAVGTKGVAEATKVTVLADAAGTEYTAISTPFRAAARTRTSAGCPASARAARRSCSTASRARMPGRRPMAPLRSPVSPPPRMRLISTPFWLGA